MSSAYTLQPRDARTRTAIACAIALHAALTAWLALARYANVHNRTFDLALYARMTWGLAHAEPWDPIVGGNFLGGHIPFILLPLALVARAASTVPVLLCTQSAALALAAWPLSRFAARRFGPNGAVLAALSWLLQPNLGHVATYEFHPGSLALWPLGVALDAFDRGQARALLLASIAVLSCRVSLALQTLPLGLLAALGPVPLRRVGRGLALGSLAYFLASILYLQPHFGVASSSSADLHFGKWGGSPFGILSALFRTPARVIEHLSAPERLRYPLLVLGPFAFLPLLAPRYLVLALPPLALNLISAFPTASQLYSHYLTPALPPLAFGAVEGAARIAKRWPVIPARATALAPLALGAAIANGLGSGLPWARDFERSTFQPDRATQAARALVRVIGPTASVQAPDPLLPHLAERALVSRTPPPDRGGEFLVFDVSHRSRYAQQETLLRTTEEPIVRAFMARPDVEVVNLYGDWLLLRRRAAPRGGLAPRYLVGRAQPGTGRALASCIEVLGASLRDLELSLEFVIDSPCPSDLALRFGADSIPARVDLLFDGLLSPAHLERGDRVRSLHRLSGAEREAVLQRGLHLGVLRSSGARPRPSDPTSVELTLHVER